MVLIDLFDMDYADISLLLSRRLLYSIRLADFTGDYAFFSAISSFTEGMSS